jgi:hypothetical protein
MRLARQKAKPRLGVRITLLKHRWRRRFIHVAVVQSDREKSEREQLEDLSLVSRGAIYRVQFNATFRVSRQGRISLEAVLTSRALMAGQRT